MTILIFGDIFGRPGRQAVSVALPDLKAKYQPDIVLCNGENLAGGKGINRKTFREMMEIGIHGMTGGNHSWDNKDVLNFIDNEERLLRPLNFPSPCPGRGYGVIRNGDKAVFVINVMGRVFMDAIDCPFAAVDYAIKQAPPSMPILVDMHADATSEKYALAWHVAGRVSAITGTHSHVQTGDERVLPGGTAYITDVGMSGSFDSVIGLNPPEVIKKFMTKRFHSYVIAKENLGVSCVVIKLGVGNKAQSIERIRYSVDSVIKEANEEP
jgi:metallophosphoesterase (TIGR00282 family)